MKKTAVQSLYEWFLSDAVHTLDDVKKRFLAAQEEEKQQILDAHMTGEGYNDQSAAKIAEKYYSEIYKTIIK